MGEFVFPVFKRYPKEGVLIGRLMGAYAELEFELCQCVAVAYDLDTALKPMFRTRGETQRIDIADALARKHYTKNGLLTLFSEAVSDMRFCLKIRNQYAHCSFYDHATKPELGMGFINFEDIANSPQHVSETTLKVYWLDHELLVKQEAFFAYVQECLWHLMREYRKRAGKMSSHAFPKPRKVRRPLLHKPKAK